MRAALAVGLASALVRFASQPIDARQLPNTISGRVLDRSGSPVPAAAVTLMRREQRRGKLEYHPVDARLLDITDANGAYRIVDAALGNYIVVAVPRNPTVKNGAINRTRFCHYVLSAQHRRSSTAIQAPAHPGRVRDDLTFEFASWPGPHYVFLDQARWCIKAIRLKGVDITDQPIDFKDGAPVSGIELELARR